MSFNIDLVRTFLQIDGQIKLDGTCFNYDKNGGVEFTGYKDGRHTRIVMDKNQLS